MDEQYKSLSDLTNGKQFNLEDAQKILQQSNLPFKSIQDYSPINNFNLPQPNRIVFPEPKEKKGFEKFYEKHTGKITIALGFLSLILAIVAIVEAYYLFLLSK